MKRMIAIAFALLIAVALGGCSEQYKNDRGRGDAPVGHQDDSSAEIINFPDGYPNVATKCGGHGQCVA